MKKRFFLSFLVKISQMFEFDSQYIFVWFNSNDVWELAKLTPVAFLWGNFLINFQLFKTNKALNATPQNTNNFLKKIRLQ